MEVAGVMEVVIRQSKKISNDQELIQSDIYKDLRNQITSPIEESKKMQRIKPKYGASNRKVGNNDNLGLKINGDIIADHSDLAETCNAYFINIAVKLKEPIEYGNFRKLQDYINSHIPENIQFELPEVDEHFVYTFLSSLDTSKATGLENFFWSYH